MDILKKIKELIRNIKIWTIFLFFLLFLGLLCFVDIHTFLRGFPFYIKLSDNLDFIEAILGKYGRIFICILVMSVLAYFHNKFTLTISNFSFAGITFSLRKPEEIIKARIRNHLNTKRSLFYFVKEYDNLYDIINTWYETLLYIRELLTDVEDERALSKECFSEVQEVLFNLNLFLTKYQSDYRRWYEYETAKGFKQLCDLQIKYCKYDEMVCDIYKLNEEMRKHGDYFGVTYNKWEPLIEKLKK